MHPLPAHLTFLEQLVNYVAATNGKYAALHKAGVNTCPIPSFGNCATAEFATFGVNPSATEFSRNRWPESVLGVARLNHRLINYFNNPDVPAHRWFDGYEKCLNILGHSYQADTVHLDLSPRATRSMGSTDRDLFSGMVAEDLPWFISSLKLCQRAKAAIMSGSVTGKYYMDEFLKQHLPQPYSLTLRRRLEDGVRGATSLYELVGPGLNIPVLFCSTSPSGDGGVRLKTEVERTLTELRAAGFQRSAVSSAAVGRSDFGPVNAP